MTHLLVLGVRMLRYRVALMVWLFLLLGTASRQGLEQLSWRHGLAALALGLSYVAATSENDIADRELDLVNHPRDGARPLVTGEANEGDLLLLHRLAAIGCLAAAVPLGLAATGLLALSLAVSWAYSCRPVRLSYRTWLAHPALAVAYVAIPYGLGLTIAGDRPRPSDARLGGGLLCLFLARIVLKDFRDREGDRRFGKPTLLLRHGKRATCIASGAALIAGNVLLLAALRPPLGAALLLEAYVAGATAMLVTLWRTSDAHAEQVAIGIGARAGNGLLVSLLAWLALETHGAPVAQSTAFLAVLAALFGTGFALLVTRPEQAVIGYKG